MKNAPEVRKFLLQRCNFPYIRRLNPKNPPRAEPELFFYFRGSHCPRTAVVPPLYYFPLLFLQPTAGLPAVYIHLCRHCRILPNHVSLRGAYHCRNVSVPERRWRTPGAPVEPLPERIGVAHVAAFFWSGIEKPASERQGSVRDWLPPGCWMDSFHDSRLNSVCKDCEVVVVAILLEILCLLLPRITLQLSAWGAEV